MDHHLSNSGSVVHRNSGRDDGIATISDPSTKRMTNPDELERPVNGAEHQTEAIPVDREHPKQRKPGPQKLTFKVIVMNFTPSWFIITMGTGVVSILFHQLPYNAHWLEIISDIFFVFNIAIFGLFSFISLCRYTVYPEIFLRVLQHPHQSLFLATFPIGLATIVNMIVLVCVPAWGQHMVILAWVLWWIISVLAIMTCFHMSYIIMSNRRGDLAHMNALWLIPVVSVVIGASTGGLVATVLPDPQHKLITIIISYVLWGIGFPLALVIMVIYFYRLTVYELPMREVIVSLLLPIGPLGLAGFSLITLGKVTQSLFPITNSLPRVSQSRPGDIIYTMSVIVALIIWGYALVWFFVAVATIIQAGKFPFNMGWWGSVFPIGIYALCTISLGNELESRFFKVLGTVLTVIVVILWLIVAAGTIYRSITGEMFFAPCLGTDLKSAQPVANKSEKRDIKKEEV